MWRRALFCFFFIAAQACGGGGGDNSEDTLEARDGRQQGQSLFTWEIERVLSEGTLGEWTRLVFDAKEEPFIAHMDVASPYNVHLTQRNNAAWSDAVMGSSSRLSSVGLALRSGEPALSYFDGSDLQFLFNGDLVAVDTEGETGDWSSLAVTGNGTFMVSYQRCFFGRDLCNDTSSSVRRDLRFAHSFDGANWSVETVEAGNMNSNSGFFTALALLGNRPVIAYYNRAVAEIRVAVHAGGSYSVPSAWTITTLLKVPGGDSRPAIAVWSQTRVGVSFFDPLSKDLYYKESDDGGLTWGSSQLVDRLGDIGSMSSVAFDAAGDPVIAYYDASDDGNGEGLRIGWKVNDLWQSQSVVRGGRLGQFPSLRFSSAGLPSISFFDGLEGDLMYSTYTGPQWPPESLP